MKTKTKAVLERENMELSAQLAFSYYQAHKSIEKASTDHLHASAVVMHLTALGGREICAPVAIRDGLSKETIEAIKGDLKRSFEGATAFKL